MFLLSLNAAFAIDDNSTDVALDESFNDDVIEIESDDAGSQSDEDVLGQEITAKNSTIEPGKVTKRYNVGVEYSANFLGGDGNPLENTIVYCGVNSIEYAVNTTTDSNGKALFILPLDKGTYNLYLFNSATSEIVQDNIKVFDVLTGGKNIKMYFNNGKSYSVRVYGDDGKAVGAGKKVTFTVKYQKLNTKTNKVSVVTKKYKIKTDKKGYAKLKITFQPGTYAVMAEYGNYFVVNQILVKPTLIHLTQFGGKAIKKSFKFKTKLLNGKGKPLKNKKIKVKFNKKTYTAKTNKKGIATFTLKTPTKTGTFKIVSSYGKATATSQLTRYAIY